MVKLNQISLSQQLNRPIKEIWESSCMKPVGDIDEPISILEEDDEPDAPKTSGSLPIRNQRVNPVRLAMRALDQLREKRGMTVGLPL